MNNSTTPITEYLALTPSQYDTVVGKPFPCIKSEAAVVAITGSHIQVKALMLDFGNADTLACRLNNLVNEGEVS